MDVETLPCPRCGGPVDTGGWSAGRTERDATGELVPHTEEGRRCPHCDAPLVRDALPGRPWRLQSG